MFPSTNLYYNKTAETGYLYFIEKLLNVINSKSDGSGDIDPRNSGNSEYANYFTGAEPIIENRNFIIQEFRLLAKTKRHDFNGR